MVRPTGVFCILGALLLPASTTAGLARGSPAGHTAPLTLRAHGVPDGTLAGPAAESRLRVMAAFRERFPHVTLLLATGIVIPGRTMDVLPLMQIAGDISPEVLYVNFRQSDTYIRNKFLYPLGRYLEARAGLLLEDGHLLPTPRYMALLTGAREELAARLPRQCWEVVRRACPHGAACPYLRQWGRPPAAEHQHVWCLPQGQAVIALFYRRDFFAEAGLPDRVPEDCDEFVDWARRLTNPRDNAYGVFISTGETGWSTLSFLYSFGGRAVARAADGRWRCTFDSEAAAAAYTFVARLFLEPFENAHGRFTSVVETGQLYTPGVKRARSFVENGLGRCARPAALRDAGYADVAATAPPGWEEAAREAMEHGVPEPYGQNCQLVYRYMSMAIDQIRGDAAVRRHIRAGDRPAAQRRSGAILAARAALADEKMLNLVPPRTGRFRRRVAALKTVPDDLYEAADIDGASVWSKVRHVALPSIRALIGFTVIQLQRLSRLECKTAGR